MKKIILRIIAAMIISTLTMPIMAASVSVSAYSAVLIEASTGDIIYEKNAHERLPMASTTKIMTALVALENTATDKIVKVCEKACGVEGSSIYLVPGEELTIGDLLYAIMLESANDAAAALAYEISGGIEEFAVLMNNTAEKIGLTDTHFTNPHGLDNEAHYTTALDLAKLTAYALKNDTFRDIVSTLKAEIPNSKKNGTRYLINHNKLLRLSDDVIGVKTGFTKRSGRCLVSAAERNGVCVISVTLNAPDDWSDHLSLHEIGLCEYCTYTLASEGQFRVEIPCTGAPNGKISTSNTDTLKIIGRIGTEFSSKIEAERLMFPPIFAGDSVGRVVFYDNKGNTVGEIPLYAEYDVPLPEDPTLIEKIQEIFR